jgi:NAD(P)-dependent dehydrogenase (short-subunit alcohol dehydrogenase family)
MQDMFSVEGRIVLITGGLGQIGHAFAEEFHDRGARVALASRTIDEAKLRAAFPDRVDSDRLMGVAMDITSKESVEAAVELVERQWGVPDVLINNAGIDTQPSAPPEVSGPFEEFPVEVFREVVDTNLVGTFLVTQAVGKRMRAAQKPGSIINVGSIYGMGSPVQDIYAYKEEKTGSIYGMGSPVQDIYAYKEEKTGVPFIKPVAYSAAKSGLYNFTRYCATYWGRDGIRVNTLTPSGVRRDTQDAEFQKNYTARMPLGRMAEADEFNGAVIFLASDASRYMTGSNVVVDGGWTAW